MTSSLVRVARDGSSAIVSDGEKYIHFTVDAKELARVDSLSDLLKLGSWRRPVTPDNEKYQALLSVSDSDTRERQLRLPKKMLSTLESLQNNEVLSQSERKRLSALVASGTATASDAQWLLELREKVESSYQTLSSENVLQWAERVRNPEDADFSNFEPSDELQYFAAGDDDDSTEVDTLLAITEEGTLLIWVGDDFVREQEDTLEDYERDYITQIGPDDAKVLADWLTEHPGESMDILGTNPTEANMFAVAESEMDLEFIDTLQAIVADATGYSREERRRNALRQRRNNAGKFAPSGKGKVKPKNKKGDRDGDGIAYEAQKKTPLEHIREDKQTPFEQSRRWHYWHRARLRKLLPLILDSGKNVAEWIEDNKALWNLRSYKPEPLAAAAEMEETTSADDRTGAIENEGVSGVYFAVVDETDHSAVLDLIAIKDDGNGNPTAWARRGGKWVQDDNMLADLQGATPPPVVRIPDEDEVKSVITQVDEYDKKNGNKPPDEQVIEASPEDEEALAAAAYSKQQRSNDAKKGYARPDGSYPIRDTSDLKNAIQAYGRSNEEDRAAVRRHIRKRAKALNRTDLIPDAWKETALQDFWEGVHAQSAFYGEFGEVITAAGVPGVADTPEDYGAVRRLKNYWTKGAGAAKINWANPEGNMTRCIALLSKYMPGRAGGYCQELHKEVFGGKTNQEVDKG